MAQLSLRIKRKRCEVIVFSFSDEFQTSILFMGLHFFNDVFLIVLMDSDGTVTIGLKPGVEL